MKNPFENVTKIALEEILKKHMNPSKYGYFLSTEKKNDIIQELLDFVKTSRSLKTSGDQFFKDNPQLTDLHE